MTFELGPGTLKLTLENTTNPIEFISDELDGLTWSFASGPALTLASVRAQGVLDCWGDHTYPCASGAGTTPYAREVGGTGSYGLKAGGGSFHPYAIINWAYTLPDTGQGGILNNQHNPLLVGPVVFDFTFVPTGTDLFPTDVQFLWGTTGTPTDGMCEGENCTPTPRCTDPNGCEPPQVPEPASMLLLGTGLLGAGIAARKRRR